MKPIQEQPNHKPLDDILRPFGRLGIDVATQMLDNLMLRFGTEHPCFIADGDGHFDTHRAAIRDGQRQVILHIKRAIQSSINEPQKPKKAKTE